MLRDSHERKGAQGGTNLRHAGSLLESQRRRMCNAGLKLGKVAASQHDRLSGLHMGKLDTNTATASNSRNAVQQCLGHQRGENVSVLRRNDIFRRPAHAIRGQGTAARAAPAAQPVLPWPPGSLHRAAPQRAPPAAAAALPRRTALACGGRWGLQGLAQGRQPPSRQRAWPPRHRQPQVRPSPPREAREMHAARAPPGHPAAPARRRWRWHAAQDQAAEGRHVLATTPLCRHSHAAMCRVPDQAP